MDGYNARMTGAADGLTREYSQRLGVLTVDQLQAALDRFDLGTIVDARTVPGGLFGQNVLLTSSNGAYVLRGAPHYDGQFEKERYFSRVVHERTQAHAPWPFLIERSTEIFGWSYALMPQLPGEHLSDPAVQRALMPHERVTLACAMGEYLALMQAATWDTPMTYDHAADDLRPFDRPFADWFVADARDWLARCRAASSETTQGDVDWVDSIIGRARAALAVPFDPVLVHTDYKDGNVVAERTSGGWRVNGVFDLGEAYIGDGEYDLARAACEYHLFARAESVQAFVAAYTAARPPRAGFAERLALYIVADRLILWEYGQRNRIWFKEGVSFREFAEPYVSLQLA